MPYAHKSVQRVQHVAKQRPFSIAAPARAPGRIAARSIGTFVPKMTRTAIEKFGFSTATLLTDWAQIVGPALALSTRPDRIKWPRAVGYGGGHGGGEDGATGARAGASLHLTVDPARALDVQYKAQLIIDRVNSYFGYRAVNELRIIQAPLAPARTEQAVRSAAPLSPVAADPSLQSIPDEGLRGALERMQAGLQSRRR